MVLRRGPYLVASGLDESGAGGRPYVLQGRYVNLFNAELAVLNTATAAPGTRMLLLDFDKAEAAGPKVVAAACRVRDEKFNGNTLTFRTDGIGSTNGVVRIAARGVPKEVLIGGKRLGSSGYDFSQDTVRLRFPNSVDPVSVEVRF
ncbi:MAG: hypothetical protein JWO80_1892 [Bryobacterales bacterium]|nr:hypothetical protein [Bryobacterales bacterium]